MAGRLQNEDFKSSADLSGGGGTDAQLLNDTKIYVTASGLNKTLSAAIIAGDIGGGGGGGGSLEWIEDINSPTPTVDSNNRVYGFVSGGGQDLFALIKVPNGYSTGKQIFLRATFYSPDNTGTALMSTQATLIRPGTDAVSTTTNQRTSTNTAVTLGAGTVNIPQAVNFDLSSSSGQINGVAVAAGHLIKIRMFRGTDTGTSDLLVPVFGAEVTFNS